MPCYDHPAECHLLLSLARDLQTAIAMFAFLCSGFALQRKRSELLLRVDLCMQTVSTVSLA